MKRALVLLVGILLGILETEARSLGYGIDAFNRVVPASASGATAFSPLSFEIDTVAFAEAVDPIRRALFTGALRVMDEFGSEYRPLAWLPVDFPGTNGVDLVWTHAFVIAETWMIEPAYRLNIQDLYGFEVCGAKNGRGVEAWVKTRFAGDFDGWRLPPLSRRDAFQLQDLVSVSVRVAPTNGWKTVCPTHLVYRQPLVGGADFYAIVPKSGRAVSSVRARVTSVSLPEILARKSAVIDPPESVRLALPSVDIVATNELAGAFSYFRLPTTALKPFYPGLHPEALRQTVKFHLRSAPPEADAAPLPGPYLFFVHDPATATLPVVGIMPGEDRE